MQVLLRNCTDPSTKQQLIHSYDMLTNPSKMGERFHFFSMLSPLQADNNCQIVMALL